MTITVEMRGDTELVARLNDMPNSVRSSLYRVITKLVLQLEASTKQKLSGDVLNVVTGQLRRSITHTVEKSSTSVIGKVFSSGNVPYAAIHEFGGTTSPHEIVASKAQALHFIMGGKDVFFKRVNHPGSVIPERSYLRSSLEDMRPTIANEIKAAIVAGLK
jgi:phage gpG-like protein